FIFISMYPDIILTSVAVCGFEFPIVLPPTIEREAEALKINKEKTREDKRRQDRRKKGYTDSAQGNPRQTTTTITPSKLTANGNTRYSTLPVQLLCHNKTTT
ncbi:MAG: hypothetical protein QN716_06955, partial [Nitrososphaeraceae archaeon]|nr:hypothetical protein [Nitrososphaeraceae archaeon]